MTYGPAASADPANPLFDNVFVNPSSYRAFLDTGHWPDKTMFVLEIRTAAGQGSINNAGHYQNERVPSKQRSKTRNASHKRGLISASTAKTPPPAMPANSSCNSCHAQNAAVENTFVQFYPTVLEVAKKAGTLNAAFMQKSASGPPSPASPAK